MPSISQQDAHQDNAEFAARWPQRTKGPAALLTLLLTGLLPSLAFAQTSFAPVNVEIHPPLDRPSIPLMRPYPLGPPPFVPPEEAERYLEDNRLAAFNLNAEPPDSILSVVESTSAPDSNTPMTEAATIPTSFPGLTQLSFPENLNPPDTTLAKSGLRVLEAANSSLALYQPGGSLLQAKSLLSFFSALPGDGIMFDPRVIYDRIGPNSRLYIVAAQVNLTSRVSNLYLAVSRSPDPSNLEPASWCRYWIPARRDEGLPWDSFADYPMLGVGTDTLALSDNQAKFSPSGFSFAIVRAFNKTVLSNNATSCPVATAYVFQPEPSMLNNLDIYSLQPVEHYTAPSSTPGFTNPVYLLSTARPPTTTYKVWAVRNIANGAATLTVADATGGTYTFDSPTDAPQLGTTILLDTNNSRIRQAVGRGNSLWAAHTTVCNSGDLPTEACIRVVRLDVTPGSGSSNHSASVRTETTLGGGVNVFYWMPGIAVNSALQTAIAFQHSSAASYLSAAWTLKSDASANYPPAQPLTTGNCAQTQRDPGVPFSRTGDYVGAQTNPNDQTSFWLAAERAANLGGNCRWDTRIIQVTP